MAPSVPAPSTRLLRAATAERGDLERHRARLLARRESLRAKLADIDESLGEIDERAALLDRLAGPRPAAALADEQDTPQSLVGLRSASPTGVLLRGPAIRRAAVQVLMEHPNRPEALHYREWYEAVRAAGHDIAGKDPLAVFLTQLGRSPVVRKGTQTGVYELDRSAPRRLRQRLDDVREELRRLTTAPSPTAELAAIRARRAQLNVEIGQLEKALEEAETVLAPADRLAAAG